MEGLLTTNINILFSTAPVIRTAVQTQMYLLTYFFCSYHVSQFDTLMWRYEVDITMCPVPKFSMGQFTPHML